ncbi:MAG: bifunctional DNA-formamidopyrimidine glycosylase/DNA-(apurinic or apyrimidinic site) lyase [Candidatus Zixiibacteriota bacterium]|nr:MAG: bifunctional DNA-formamidopyrimidine glycosylase/DNA-(apurinic or apyrimidinic site) lyase [candidate division Zixibacteria bacterium]
MPELPEVETVVRGLRRTIKGATIQKVRVDAPPSSIVVSPTFDGVGFEKLLAGKSIRAVNRRGKNILISLSGNLTLWVHLKMTGKFLWVERSKPVDKHDLVIMELSNFHTPDSNSIYHLRFNDYRRFGRLRLFTDSELWQQEGLATLGPEPLELGEEEFIRLFRRQPRMIKPALLDQTFIAGVGNIYADESLHAARIHPKRLTTSLSRRKLVELHKHLQSLLKAAIRMKGTSVASYAGVSGRSGRFQNHLRVYGREGEACYRCSGQIARKKIGSRSAYHCPRCQRTPPLSRRGTTRHGHR